MHVTTLFKLIIIYIFTVVFGIGNIINGGIGGYLLYKTKNFTECDAIWLVNCCNMCFYITVGILSIILFVKISDMLQRWIYYESYLTKTIGRFLIFLVVIVNIGLIIANSIFIHNKINKPCFENPDDQHKKLVLYLQSSLISQIVNIIYGSTLTCLIRWAINRSEYIYMDSFLTS